MVRCGLLLSRRNPSRLRTAGLLILGAALVFSWKIVNWEELVRPLPLVLAALCCFWNIKKPLHTGFALFSLLLLLKMILNVHVYSYGILLAMPGVVLIAGWLTSLQIFSWRLLVMSGITLYVTAMILLSNGFYETKKFQVSKESDSFLTFNASLKNSKGPVYAELLPWLENNVSPNEGLLVMPEGVIINYLARRDNPGRLFEFTPNLLESLGEKSVIDIIQEANPGYIVITDRDTSEHGASCFGKDYGVAIKEWIKIRYEVIQQIGAKPCQGEGFGVLILKKIIWS